MTNLWQAEKFEKLRITLKSKAEYSKMNINLGVHYINSVNSICGLSFTDFVPACFEHFTGAGVDGN